MRPGLCDGGLGKYLPTKFISMFLNTKSGLDMFSGASGHRTQSICSKLGSTFKFDCRSISFTSIVTHSVSKSAIG